MGNNMSEIHKSAMDGNYQELCHKLQHHSSQINQQEDKYGWTALHFAAIKGFEAILRELLLRGASVDIADKESKTALHLACKEGHTQCAKDLLRNKANPHLLDKDGKSPLDLVPLGDKHQALRWLITAARASTPHPTLAPSPADQLQGQVAAMSIKPQQAATAARPYTAAPTQGAAGVHSCTPSSAPGPAVGPLHSSTPSLGAPQSQTATSAYPSIPVAGWVGGQQASSTPSSGSFSGSGTAQSSGAAAAANSNTPSWVAQMPSGPPNMPAPYATAPPPPLSHRPPPPPLQQGGVYDLSQPGAMNNFHHGMSGQHVSGSLVPRPPDSLVGTTAQMPPRSSSQGSDGGWGGGGGGAAGVNPYAPQPYHGYPPPNAQQHGNMPPPSLPVHDQLQHQEEEKPGNPFMFWKKKNRKDSKKNSLSNSPAVSSGGASGAPVGYPATGADNDSDGGWGEDSETDWGGAPAHVPISPAEAAVNQLNQLGSMVQVVQYPGAAGHPGPSDHQQYAAGPSGRTYTYDTLKSCTGGFAPSNKIGEGGYGPVYRGTLDGIPVAVKVMDQGPNAMQGLREFGSEVAILSRLHHPHIVLLIGSCPENGALVYELMSGGTLDDLLFRGPSRSPAPGHRPILWWQDRVRIAAEIASALLFLHSSHDPIVHMDLKPSNILLDHNLTAKLGDVGLARLVKGRQQQQHGGKNSGVQDSHLVGTMAYMDPEYLQSGQFSPRSDVYALGIVMLQMLTGTESKSIIQTVDQARAEPHLRFPGILDQTAGPWPATEAIAFADLALKCVALRRQDRPDVRSTVLPTLLQLRQRTMLYPPANGAAAPPPPAPAPDMFICPITQEIMNDPVFAADGYTYERLAISEWMARSQNSPLTNMALEHKHLVPNHTLRSAIKEWLERHRRM